MNSKSKKIIVVANDAGGAEILAAYIRANPDSYFSSYTSGPAARIFEREGLNYEPASVAIVEANQNANLVLTGTGWMTPIERRAIVAAKKIGIRTAAFLDHWVNYRERFGYPDPDWHNNLPDEIWVGDEAAEKLAKTFFPGKLIRLIPNPYFSSFTDRYKTFLKANSEGEGLLFIGEPNNYVQTALTHLLDYLVGRDFTTPMILRSHPAEGRERYDGILKKYSNKLFLSVSDNKNILEDFLASRVVVGMESAALVLALKCNKPVFSFITDPKIICPLPFSGILKLRSVDELTALDQYLS